MKGFSFRRRFVRNDAIRADGKTIDQTVKAPLPRTGDLEIYVRAPEDDSFRPFDGNGIGNEPLRWPFFHRQHVKAIAQSMAEGNPGYDFDVRYDDDTAYEEFDYREYEGSYRPDLKGFDFRAPKTRRMDGQTDIGSFAPRAVPNHPEWPPFPSDDEPLDNPYDPMDDPLYEPWMRSPIRPEGRHMEIVALIPGDSRKWYYTGSVLRASESTVQYYDPNEAETVRRKLEELGRTHPDYVFEVEYAEPVRKKIADEPYVGDLPPMSEEFVTADRLRRSDASVRRRVEEISSDPVDTYSTQTYGVQVVTAPIAGRLTPSSKADAIGASIIEMTEGRTRPLKATVRKGVYYGVLEVDAPEIGDARRILVSGRVVDNGDRTFSVVLDQSDTGSPNMDVPRTYMAMLDEPVTEQDAMFRKRMSERYDGDGRPWDDRRYTVDGTETDVGTVVAKLSRFSGRTPKQVLSDPGFRGMRVYDEVDMGQEGTLARSYARRMRR